MNQESSMDKFLSTEGEYDDNMDPECVELCDALNRLPGIMTVGSCSGHGVRPFWISYYAHNMGALAPALRFIGETPDGDMPGRWRTTIQLDHKEVPFLILEGPVGARGFKDAKKLAEKIEREEEERDE